MGAQNLERSLQEILDDVAAGKPPPPAEVVDLCEIAQEASLLGQRCEALELGIKKLGYFVVDTTTDDDAGGMALEFFPIADPNDV